MKINSIITLAMALLMYGCSSEHHVLEYAPSDAKLPPLLVLGDTTYFKMVDDAVLSSLDSTASDSEAEVISKVAPTYPPIALANGTEADVFVKACITKEGTVRQVRVFKSSDNLFNRAAAEAAMQWIFKPGLLKGKPVACWVMIPFRFRLEK